MKSKAPKFLRFFMVLALLVGVIGTVVPVGKVGAGHASEILIAPTLTTSNVGKNAGYTIVASTFTAVPALGTVTVTFPSGTTVPAVINRGSVSINGVAPSSDPFVVGRAVTITNSGVATTAGVGGLNVIFAASAGIKNPTAVSTTKTLTVSTSADATAKTSAVYSTTRYVTPSSTSKAQGAAITITGGGFTGGTLITSTGTITGSSVVNADGSFSIAGTRSGTATGAATVTDGANVVLATASITLKPDITVSGSPSISTGTVTLNLRNFGTAANIPTLTHVTFGGTAVTAGQMVSTLGTAFTDRDLDQVADDYKLQIRVPAGTSPGVRQVTVTDSVGGTANANVEVSARSVTISPSSGRTGTITISGTGFPPSVAASSNNIITLTQAGSSGNLSTPQITTDTAGAFNTTFTMPSSVPSGNAFVTGAVTVKVTVKTLTGDTGANTKSATYTWTSTSRTLTVSPTSGPRGTVVTVTGSGFTASGTIAANALTVGGAGMNSSSFSVNADKTLTATTQTIPAGTAYGSNTVKATDGTLSGTTSFTAIQPTIAISPTSGPVGSTINVTGSGWMPNGLVTVTRSGSAALTVSANALGEITAQLPIPSSLYTGGSVNVTVGSNDGTSVGNTAAGLIFKISSSSISASPGSAAVGDVVTVTGSNYLPSTGLTTFSIGGVSVLPRDPVISNGTGTWTASFTVPGLSGVNTITSTHSAITKTATLTITTSAGGAGQPVNADTAVLSLTTAGSLEVVTSFNYTTNLYEAFVPGLAGNPLTQIKPNSVIILTLSADSTVIVSGVTFTVSANVPTPIPVGNTVSITLG